MSARMRARLWLHYRLRRHPLTGRRVRRMRWHTERVAGNGTFRVVHKLGAWDDRAGIWAGWEWPG